MLTKDSDLAIVMSEIERLGQRDYFISHYDLVELKFTIMAKLEKQKEQEERQQKQIFEHHENDGDVDDDNVLPDLERIEGLPDLERFEGEEDKMKIDVFQEQQQLFEHHDVDDDIVLPDLVYPNLV